MPKFKGISNNQLLGTAIVTVLEPTLDAYLDKFGGNINIGVNIDIKDVGKGIVGYLLKGQKNTTVKAMGDTLMILGVRNLIRNALGSRTGTASNDGWN